MPRKRKNWKVVSGCGRDARKDNCTSDRMIRYSRSDEAEVFNKLPRKLRDWLNYAPSKFSALEIAAIYRREKSIARTIAVLDANIAKRWPDYVPI